MFLKALEPTGSVVEESKLFLKINQTKADILGSLLTGMQSQDNSKLFLNTQVLSDLLLKIKARLLSAQQGQEVKTMDEAVLAKTVTKPSKKSLQKICSEVMQEMK